MPMAVGRISYYHLRMLGLFPLPQALMSLVQPSGDMTSRVIFYML
jgi:hypothetical protein